MPRDLRPAKETLLVRMHYSNVDWYRSLGYSVEDAVIEIKTVDLHPGSMRSVELICDTCSGVYSSRWREYYKKKSNTCQKCLNHPSNCCSHEYWLQKLLLTNAEAVCNVCGELDKRFLVLHHLLGRNGGGKNSEYNYAVVCSNHHTAFHREIGPRTVATPEAYYAFKQKENE